MGLTMPNLTVSVQNAVDRNRLGAATSTLSFMRSLGASFGVSLFGGLMTVRLAQALSRRAADVDAKTLLQSGIHEIATLAPERKALIISAYHEAIGTVFLAASMVAALAFFIVLLMPEAPLRSREKRDASETLMELEA
jgi:hypothetical protein